MEFANNKETGNIKVVPDHATKSQRQSTDRAPVTVKHSTIRNFICQQVQCAPGNKHLVHIQQEPGWAPDLVWTFWRTGKPFVPARNPTLDHPDHSTVTVPTTWPWLLIITNISYDNIHHWSSYNLAYTLIIWCELYWVMCSESFN